MRDSGLVQEACVDGECVGSKVDSKEFSPPSSHDDHEQPSAASAQAQGKFVIRLPAGLLDKLSRISRQHQRSMNTEINLLLGRYLEEQGLVDSAADDDQQESLDARLLRKLSSMPPEKREALLQLLE